MGALPDDIFLLVHADKDSPRLSSAITTSTQVRFMLDLPSLNPSATVAATA